MKLLLRTTFIVVFSIQAVLLSAQNQNKIWYFGDHAGLDFNSGSPVPLLLGQLSTAEGCTSVADNAGVLLFYTDGQTVYNKNHLVMPNGTGLLGNPSTTQSALIVPAPGNASLYYIFTIDDLAGTMNYSIVDMTMAAGLGDVTAVKNVLLHPSVTEKQAAVLKCDGNIWVISHEWATDTFFADLVTASGISPTVSSSAGTVHIGGGGPAYNSVGQMKISQQGNRIGLAIRDAGLFEVLNFDISTGIVSSPITISPGTYYTAYGVEFSPDGSKLYGGTLLGNNVFQFNLLAGSATAIAASAVMVGSSGGLTNSLQLGTDGKIYVAKSNSQTAGIGSLDVINNPNNLGAACSYIIGGRSLGGKLSLLGLPALMVRPPPAVLNVSIAGATTICSGQSTTLTASGAPSFVWSGGSTATTASITVSPSVTTDYFVTGSNGCGSDQDTITVQVDSPININVTSSNDTICAGQTVNINAAGSTTYQWSGGSSSTAPAITVTPLSTTTYYVSGASNACPMDMDTILITVKNIPAINVTGTDSICIGQSTTLTASGASSYTWSGGSIAATSSITVSPAVNTFYYVSSSNSCGTNTDTVNVRVDSPININVTSSDDSICSGQAITATASGSTTFQWSGGAAATSSSITVSPVANTTYYVSNTANACATDTDTLTVYVDHPITIAVSGTSSLCTGQSTALTASGASYYIWSGGNAATTASITVAPSITTAYYVTSANICGSNTDTITVTVDTIPVITVTGPATICSGASIVLTASGAASYVWSGGTTSSGTSVTVSPLLNTTYAVTGINGSCSSIAAIYSVTVNSRPVVALNGPALLCENASGNYLAAVTGGTAPYLYNWSDGAVSAGTSFMPVLVTTPLNVTVTDVNGCMDSSALTVVVIPDPIPVIGSGFSGCAPFNVDFVNESTNAVTYQWDFGNGTTSTLQNPSYQYTTPGSYDITLITTNLAGCPDTLFVASYVTVFPSPVAQITTSGNVTSDHPVLTVYNNSTDGDNCVLYFGDGSSMAGCNWSSTTHSYENEGDYTITQIVNNANGCADTTETTMNVTYDNTFYAANAFSPNSNGNNDIFYVYGTGLMDFKLMIFDRWGEKIFESDNILKGWDGTYKGKPVEQDVYVWKAYYTTKRLGEQTKIGHVTVLR